jgi:NADPH-dependent 2,4-dienoyl-CoA reductase/sulfur reductase-like enzyme
LAAEMKKVLKIPVAMAYRLSKPELAEKAIAEGRLDFWEMCRPLLADPYLPKKVAEGRPEDIAPCIACNQGCMDRIFSDEEICCIINPYLGKEGDPRYQIKPAKKSKKVFVIGGGPAGMEAAKTAGKRGHRVTLFEKENELGGQLFIAALPPYKHEINSAREYFVREVKRSHVGIRTGVEASVKMIEDEKPDVVIVATGAVHLSPPMSGKEMDQVVSAEDILWGRKEAGQEVVVIGGERVACETAEFLADKGKHVTVVRQGPKMGVRVGPVQRGRLLTRLREKGVTLMTGVKKFEEVTKEGLKLIDKDGNQRTIKADTIVYGVGMKAENRLARELEGKVSELYTIGDCVRPREILEAVDEGARVACEV